LSQIQSITVFLQCSDTVGWTTERHPACVGFVGDDMTGALHVL